MTNMEILEMHRKQLDDVYKLLKETVDIIKDIHIAKYNQDEFRSIVGTIHHEKIMQHYTTLIQESNDKQANHK